MAIVLLIGSVIVGGLLGKLLANHKNIQKLILVFSGAYLLTITILEIFPNVYRYSYEFPHLPLYILLGVGIQIFLESITQGAEHGHIHFHNEKGFPISIFLGLFIHAFIEGIPIHLGDNNHLLTAILIHKIPIAFILYTFLSATTHLEWKKWLFLLLFSLASPLGYLLGNDLNEEMLYVFLAIASGIFLHISTVIIFESTDGHKLKLQKILMLLIGFGMAYLGLQLH